MKKRLTYILKKFLPAVLAVFPLLCGSQFVRQIQKFTTPEIISAPSLPDTPDKKILHEIFNSTATACRNRSEYIQEEEVRDFFPQRTEAKLKKSDLHYIANSEKFNIFLQEIRLITISDRDGPVT
jgi:hypothetical protein